MTSAELEFRFALESFKRGDHADAERRLKAAAKAQPRHPGVLNLLGVLLASPGALPGSRARSARRNEDTAGFRRDPLQSWPRAAELEPPAGRSRRLRQGAGEESRAAPTPGSVAAACCWRAASRKSRSPASTARSPSIGITRSPSATRARRCSNCADLPRRCSISTSAFGSNPRFATAHLSKARALHNLRQFGLALASAETATALAPNVALGWAVRSNICRNCAASTRRSSACGKRCRSIRRTRIGETALVDQKLWTCEWSSYQSDFDALREAIRAGVAVSPWLCIMLPFSAAEQFAAAQARIKAKLLARRSVSRNRPSSRQARIRIAYLSGELRTHATAILFVGVLERHDRSRFEITVLNNAARDHSPLQKRIIDAVESFVDVYEFDDDRLD